MMRFIILLLLCLPLSAKELQFVTYTSGQIKEHLKEAKSFCDTIYCSSPYLHHGHDAGYESYLKQYSNNEDALLTFAYDESKLVGFAAGMPLSAVDKQFKQALIDHAHNVETIYYLGEFGLHPDYEKPEYAKGLYKCVEDFARASGKYRMVCFWEISEASNPTQKPPGTIFHDDFWKKIGFIRYPKLQFLMFWADINEANESPHLAIYWAKGLRPNV